MGGNMIIPRSFKQPVCRVLTGTLLFSQLAVAKGVGELVAVHWLFQ
jgi:hypothetical protein